MFAKVPYVRYFFGKMYFCGKVWNTIERVVHLSGMVGVILLKVPYARQFFDPCLNELMYGKVPYVRYIFVLWVCLLAVQSTVCPVLFMFPGRQIVGLLDVCFKSALCSLLQLHLFNSQLVITYHMFSFSSRRTYVCEYFDYAYVGVNKEVGKDWNNRFISFIPFLCGLTLDLSQQLRSICELESSSKLLFQQSVEDVQQVCLCTSFA